MVCKRHSILTTAFLLSASLSQAFAHNHVGHDTSSDTVSPATIPQNDSFSSPPPMAALNPSVASPQSYFSHPAASGLILAHIILMTVAWFFILPVGVMLSLARSRFVLHSQLLFFCVNGFGLLLGAVYNSKTQDLYENNMHHWLGWVVTLVLLIQCGFGVVRSFAHGKEIVESSLEEQASFIPISTEAMQHHQSMQDILASEQYRYSRDSGQGTEPESARSHSISSLLHREDAPQVSDNWRDVNIGPSHNEKVAHLYGPKTKRIMYRIVSGLPSRIASIMDFFYQATDRLILILGFVLVISGMVTYGGVFRGDDIFNGLAHAIKGGIFIWYGLLTLGRWMGCFVEYGWAWNMRPPVGVVSSREAAMPSAEFIESFVIFLYGSTNVFLEHLAAWGDAWSPSDLEHVSISIMFFGGGLCGMLLESRYIRDLLNTTILVMPSRRHDTQLPIDRWEPPRNYPFSMNPFPALIILLLGLMMSSHHQASIVSTMVHKQWGTLFVGFALARAVTYILTYIAPPSSFLPSRPPTEVVASFCLVSGGIIFIASNKNTVSAMEHYDLNAMFAFTVTMGFTAFLIAWAIIVLAVKGWAIRRRYGYCSDA